VKLVYFTHSLASCWNHGNAHFLRGVLRELKHAGHEVLALEPAEAWSLQNLLRDHGDAGLDAYRAAYPDLDSRAFRGFGDVEAALDGADALIVHEWNEPELVAALGRARRGGGGAGGARFALLFHDTHHRAVSDPDAIRRFDLEGYDGVLAFGEALAQVYRRWGWGDRVFVWHEAADTRLFRPPEREGAREGLVWIGNWGDDERGAELESFLLRPARSAGLPLDIHGVRYPESALRALDGHGARHRGWLPNARAPEVFARHLATVHVPRRFYVDKLPGIPTIRVFEALACGIPLLSAPWRDSEGLFRPGEDYLVAQDEAEMARHMAAVRDDAELRHMLVANGLAAIRARHSCAHRAGELLGILRCLGAGAAKKETMAG
jgi:spore maturation protein CgeB